MSASFQGGTPLPAVGTPAYNAAASASGAGSYNPQTNTLSINGGGNSTSWTPSSGWSNSGLAPGVSAPPPIPSAIDGSGLSSQNNQYNIPSQTPTTNSNAFVSSLPGSQVSSNGTANVGNSAADSIKRMILGNTADVAGQVSSEGDTYKAAAEQAQIPEQMQNLANIRGTIAQRTAAYTAQWQLANTEHAALPYITGEQTQIQRTQAVELGMLTAQEQALSGNLQASEDYVDQSISHQFDGLKSALTAYGQLYQEVGNDLTDSEKQTVQYNYGIQTINYQNLVNTGKDISNTLAQQGLLTPAIATSLSKATSISDFWGIYSNAINGTSGASSAENPIINGVDYSSYATSSNTIANTRATADFIGQVTSIDGADKAISSLQEGSPITGNMVLQAANQYGIDPTLLISTMNAETQLGTDGSAGSRGNNYGNVGNTDSAMAAGKPINYPSPQSGVNAVAAWISQHKVSASQVATGQTAATTQGGQDFATLQASAPPGIGAPGVLNQITSTGGSYIDLSKVSKDVSQTFLSNWAKAHNVAILNSDEVTQVKSVDEAIRNITQVIAPAWSQIAYNSRLGQIGGKVTEPFGSTLDTDTYSQNNTFLENKENLAQQISALSKAAPRLGLLSTAADALPDNSGYFATGNVFSSANPLSGFGLINYGLGDTYKDGVNKLNRTLGLLNQAVASYIPGDKGVALLPTTRDGTSPSQPSNITTAPDGRTIQITD